MNPATVAHVLPPREQHNERGSECSRLDSTLDEIGYRDEPDVVTWASLVCGAAILAVLVWRLGASASLEGVARG